MQTKKRAKPVKFGKAAKEAELKAAEKEQPAEEAASPAEPPQHHASSTHAAPAESAAPAGGELVDKLSDVPFETDFNSPGAASEPEAPSQPENPIPSPAPVEPSEPVDITKSENAPIQEEPTPPASGGAIPPIGRSNEPIPFNPHDTVFNTPPDAGEKKRNPVVLFLVTALIAFVTGIAFMAGIYYAVPDKKMFALPSISGLPSVPGLEQPTPTPQIVAKASPTPVPSAKIADYTISVLNGSGVRGEAAKVKTSLEAEGFKVGTIGNADRNDVAKTQITYKKSVSKDAITKLVTTLKKTYVLEKETELPASSSQTADIVVTIGKETAK